MYLIVSSLFEHKFHLSMRLAMISVDNPVRRKRMSDARASAKHAILMCSRTENRYGCECAMVHLLTQQLR